MKNLMIITFIFLVMGMTTITFADVNSNVRDSKVTTTQQVERDVDNDEGYGNLGLLGLLGLAGLYPLFKRRDNIVEYSADRTY